MSDATLYYFFKLYYKSKCAIEGQPEHAVKWTKPEKNMHLISFLLNSVDVSAPLGGGKSILFCGAPPSLCSRGSQDGSHHEGNRSKY